MLIYDGTKEDFIKRIEDDSIASLIEQTIEEKMHRHTAKNEYRAWENSLRYMYIVLSDSSIPSDAGIAVEYNIPMTAKRIDFLISGFNDDDQGNVVVIELKQWDSLEALERKDGVVRTFTGGAMREVVHPSYQAWSYAQMIRDYNLYVQTGNIELHPCAYLHNYQRKDNDPLDAKQYESYYEDSPAFTKGQVHKLRKFIEQSITQGDDERLLYCIDHGKIKPSKSLQDNIASMLKGNAVFTLLDEQKVVYESILNISRRAQAQSQKEVIIVKGGPGTGKSVVAINALAKLTNEDQYCQYVSKNSAPRSVYAHLLKGSVSKSNIDLLFSGSGSFTTMANNTVDTILVDEAHRLNEKSGLFQNKGENQIKEIIHASKCSVFFIDENQRVTLKDIGSVEEIQFFAEAENAHVSEMELVSQFRCNGSNGYLAWIDQVLGIRPTANFDMKDMDYDIRIMDSPKEMQDLILQRNEETHNKARILAGYCWEWNSQGNNDTNVHDIQIGDFGISWNLKNTSTYAIDEDSVHEAGCIHTSQGLEFDYVGVIMGEDLRYEDGKVITDFTKRASTDQSLKGIKKIYKENPEKATRLADEIIKNTYRTLLTRGMKGCYVYCCDQNLSDYLKKSL